MAHVAYKGETPIVQDIVGGQIAWGIASIGTLEPHIASGRVRALVLFGERRSSNLPSVPTMTEAGLTEAECRTMGWVGLLAPANTPAPTIDMLEKNARSAVRSPAMQAHFEKFGSEAIGNTPIGFRRNFDASMPVIERVIKMLGIKIEQ